MFGSQLLNKQVRVDKRREMKEVIGNYEKRISELRAILISKEAEINYVECDLGRESYPTK